MKLYEIVIEILDEADLISITELHRRVAEKGYKVHRLFLTGYLYAMVDRGEIRFYQPAANVKLVSKHTHHKLPKAETDVGARDDRS